MVQDLAPLQALPLELQYEICVYLKWGDTINALFTLQLWPDRLLCRRCATFHAQDAFVKPSRLQHLYCHEPIATVNFGPSKVATDVLNAAVQGTTAPGSP